MSTYSDHSTTTHGDHERSSTPKVRSTTGDETKPAFKTTELVGYILAVVGVLIASQVVGRGNTSQDFGAERAWYFVTLLTIGYMVSRGLAKAGSRSNDDDRRS